MTPGIWRALHDKHLLDAGTLWAQSEEYKKLDEFEKKRYRKTRPEEIREACAKISDEYLLTLEFVFQDKLYDFKSKTFKFESFTEVVFGEGSGTANRPGDVCELQFDRDIEFPKLRYAEAKAEELAKKRKSMTVRIQVGRLAWRERKMTEEERANFENYQIPPAVGLWGEVIAVEFDFPGQELIYKKFR